MISPQDFERERLSGECPVKACCEGKSHEHCGLCGEFSCKRLNDFAYDKERGDNGNRIEQCREWAKGE